MNQFERDVILRYQEKMAALVEKIAGPTTMDPNDPSNRGQAYTSRLEDLRSRVHGYGGNMNSQQAPQQAPSPYMSQQEAQYMQPPAQPARRSGARAKSQAQPQPQPKPQSNNGTGPGALNIRPASIMERNPNPHVSVSTGLPGMGPVNIPKPGMPVASREPVYDQYHSEIGPVTSPIYDTPPTQTVITPNPEVMVPGVFSAEQVSQ